MGLLAFNKGLHRVYRTGGSVCMLQPDTWTCSSGSYKHCRLSAPIYTALFVKDQKPHLAPAPVGCRAVDAEL